MSQSPDIIIIKPRVHTGDLRSAGGELIEYGLRVSEWAHSATAEVNSALSVLPQPELIRYHVNPQRMAFGLRQGWRKADWATSRLLVSVGAMTYPPKPPITEIIKSHPEVEVFPKPLSMKIPDGEFYQQVQQRLNSLNQPERRIEEGSINWLKDVYSQNFLLRTAVYEGIYLL